MNSPALPVGEIPTVAFLYSDDDRTAFWFDGDGRRQSITARDGYVLRFHINNDWNVTYHEVKADE